MFIQGMMSIISKTYPYLLDREIRVFINDKPIQPMTIPIATSSSITYGEEVYSDNDVKVSIYTSLASRSEEDDTWRLENAGWYILCNGRVVLRANKDEVTGWGREGLLPRFVSKHRGFVGLVFFESKDGLKLPWRTTKSGINQESELYQSALLKMTTAARPVITFLNKMYPGDDADATTERSVVKGLNPLKLAESKSTKSQTFSVRTKRSTPKETVNIQFTASVKDIEIAKKHLRDWKIGAGAIAKKAFDYYIDNVCKD